MQRSSLKRGLVPVWGAAGAALAREPSHRYHDETTNAPL